MNAVQIANALNVGRALPDADRPAYIARVRAKYGDALADLLAYHLVRKEEPAAD